MDDHRRKNLPSTLTPEENFSSTTALAKKDFQVLGASNQSVNTNNEPYNPFFNRDLTLATSTTGAFLHLLKSSLGSGILAMPNAFKNGGLTFSFIATLVVGFICAYCVHILVKVSQEICFHARIPSMGFSETSQAAFEYGPKQLRKFAPAARFFVDFALLFTYFMGNSVYIVFIAESIKQLFDHWYLDNGLGIYIYILGVMACLLVASQVRELKHLVPYSFCANLFIVISFSITLYYIFQDLPSPKDRDQMGKITNLPIFFSTVIFAMEGIGTVMPIENNMKKPQQFLGCPGVLSVAMSTVVILYASIGFLGYLKYGPITEPSITINLPVEEIPAQVVKILIALSVFFSYNLQLYVPTEILWRKYIGSHATTTTKRHLYQVLMRCTFVFGTTAVALAVPDLEPIIGLVGSICFSTLGLFIPAVIETVWKWDGRLGVFNWILYKNIFLAAFSIFALIVGTMQSIRTFIANSKNES